MTLCANRPDLDDSFYVNLAVTALDYPTWPLLKYDGMMGMGLTQYLPVYRANSYELLAALLAAVSGAEPITVVHCVMAPAAAALLIYAVADLQQLLCGNRQILMAALIATICILLLDGELHRSFGNFSFVRLFQGKAVFVSVGVPLIASNTVRFMRTPTIQRWGLLFATVVTCVGLTSSAIVSAPVAVLVTVIGCATKRQWRVAVVALTSTWHSVAVAMILKLSATSAAIHTSPPKDSPSEPIWESLATSGLMARATMQEVLGTGPFSIITIVLLALGAMGVAGIACRRYSAAVMLVTFGFLLNPVFFGLDAHHFLGNYQPWRLAFWSVPLPALLGLLLPSTMAWALKKRAPVRLLPQALLMLPVLAACGWRGTTLSSANRTSFGLPGLKVSEHEFAAAAALNQAAPAQHVLAPESVSVWVPTTRHHAFPQFSRHGYLHAASPWLNPAMQQWRRMLAGYLKGVHRNDDSAARLHHYLRTYHVQAVVLDQGVPWREEIVQVLRSANMALHTNVQGYLVYRRQIAGVGRQGP